MKEKLYMLLCVGRIVLVFLPQIGYIHPDEHFQGPEVVYGDILNYAVHRTWEFNSSNPVRSIFFPYLITGTASLITLLIRITDLHGTKWYPYLLLILPRIFVCSLSFVNDFFLYKICKMLKRNYTICLTTFGSSYITIVYLTRTFSNSIETLMFTFFIFLLCEILHSFDQISDKKRLNSKMKKILYSSYMVGFVFTLGVFNRPTFTCFAIYPLAIWIYKLLNSNFGTIRKLKIFSSFCLSSISLSISLISIDSFYYMKGNLFDLMSQKHLNSIVFTPINFLLYNTNKNNLEAHGQHPIWLHICVNIPLLFLLNGLLILIYFFKNLKNIALKFNHMFFVLSFVTPLLLLSLIPHQEARFLIPLVIPMSLLCTYNYLSNYLKKKFFICLWCIFNVFGVMFYGFFHQSGVYLSLSHIHTFIHAKHNSIAVYYRTYMPPHYLLAIKEEQPVCNVYDFSGRRLTELQLGIENIISESYPDLMFIVLPFESSTSVQQFEIFSKYKYVRHDYFSPHLSTENLPKLYEMIDIIKNNSSFTNKLHTLKKMFSISVLTYKKPTLN